MAGGDEDMGHAEQQPLWELGVGAQPPFRGQVCPHVLLAGWTVSPWPVIPPEGEVSLLCRFSTASSLNSKQERKSSQPSLPSSLPHLRHWM